MGWVTGVLWALGSAVWASKVYTLNGSIGALVAIGCAAIYIVMALLIAVREVR